MREKLEKVVLILLAILVYILPVLLFITGYSFIYIANIIPINPNVLFGLGFLFVLICTFARNFILIFMYSLKNKFPYLNNKLEMISDNIKFRWKIFGLLLFFDVLYFIVIYNCPKDFVNYAILSRTYFGLTPIYVTYLLFSRDILKYLKKNFHPVKLKDFEKIVFTFLFVITTVPDLLIITFFIFLPGMSV